VDCADTDFAIDTVSFNVWYRLPEEKGLNLGRQLSEPPAEGRGKSRD
jgi:hypothetical protein